MAYQVPMRCWAEVVSVGMGLEGTYESVGEKGLPSSALFSFYTTEPKVCLQKRPRN